jgi:hypothetical protein
MIRFLFFLPYNVAQFAITNWALLVLGGALVYLARFRNMPLYRRALAKSEWILTASLVVLAIGLQIAFWTHAGGFWRDEANSINLATVPRVRDIWDHLDGDSFPMLWFLVLRAWAWMGLAGNDMSIRALALLWALGILAAIWWNSRRFGVSYPVISLLLVACNPVFIRCVGSNRAYGLGIALLLATYGAVWTLTCHPINSARFVGACLLAILCVQCVFYNTVFLWMIIASAAIVCLYRKDRMHAAACVGIGLIATATMLPYVITVHKQHEWSAYIASAPRLSDILHSLTSVMDKQGPLSTGAGICLCSFALVFSVRYLTSRAENRPTEPARDRVLFSALCFVLCGIGTVVFLWALKYTVRPWYFAGFLALAGLSLDALLTAAVAKDEARRTMRAYFAVAIAFASFVMTRQAVMARQTNIDVVASTLQSTSKRNDIILVVPWYFGTSFDRYYRGQAAWQSVPPMPYYRFDFVKNMVEAVQREQTIEPDLGRIRAALQAGGRVLIVGDMLPVQALTRRSSGGREHRQLERCLSNWYLQIRNDLRSHSMLVARANIHDGPDINVDENAGVETWQGWHDAPTFAQARMPERLPTIVHRDREHTAP